MPRSAEKLADHYATMRCRPDASTEELKRCFAALALRYHPDKRGATEKFDAVYQAFELLRDPARRHAYDMEWKRASRSTSPASAYKGPQKKCPPEIPDSCQDDFRSEGITSLFITMLSSVTTRSERIRRVSILPRAACEALANNLAEQMRKSSSRSSVRGTTWRRQKSKSDQLESAAPSSKAGKHSVDSSKEVLRFIQRTDNGFETQVKARGFLVRWCGKDWPACIQAIMLLQALKVLLLESKQTGMSAAAPRAALEKVAKEENGGWPLPFSFSCCKTINGVRYQAPWLNDESLAVLAQNHLRELAQAQATKKALKKWANSIDQLDSQNSPNISEASVRKLYELVESCRDQGSVAPATPPPARRRSSPGPEEQLAAPSTKRRRLRQKSAQKAYYVDESPMYQPKSSSMQTSKLTDCMLHVSLPWLPALASKHELSTAQVQRELRELSHSKRVQDLLQCEFLAQVGRRSVMPEGNLPILLGFPSASRGPHSRGEAKAPLMLPATPKRERVEETPMLKQEIIVKNEKTPGSERKSGLMQPLKWFARVLPGRQSTA